MTTLTSTFRAARSLTLPSTPTPPDRARETAASPAQAVQAAARAIPHGVLQPVCAPDAGLAFQPRALLAVLSYCYVHEIYLSSDIEDLMYRDAHFRSLCGNEIPDARTLRNFRRHNHEAIEHCLAAALRTHSEQNGGHPADMEVLAEARQRLSTAILMDMHEN